MDGFTVIIYDDAWKITVTSKRGCWVKDMFTAALPIVVEKDADWRGAPARMMSTLKPGNYTRTGQLKRDAYQTTYATWTRSTSQNRQGVSHYLGRPWWRRIVDRHLYTQIQAQRLRNRCAGAYATSPKLTSLLP